MGSEMCIRDRFLRCSHLAPNTQKPLITPIATPPKTRQRTKNISHHENIARATNLRNCRKQTHSFRPVSLTMSQYSLSCTSCGGKSLRKFDLRENLRNKTNFPLNRFWRCQASLTLLNRYFLFNVFPSIVAANVNVFFRRSYTISVVYTLVV